MSEVKLTYKRVHTEGFRSELEAKVAHHLTERGVAWRYEQPVVLPDGTSPNYLPDFTIDDAPAELMLPRWVEVKPAQHLYDLRAHVGIDARYGDKFSNDIHVDDIDSSDLKKVAIERLWKPKYLAELTGQAVLVTATAGATESLSIEMRSDCLVFSRRHPFVNWYGHQRRLQRELQREEWRIAEEQRQAVAEQQRAAVRAERAQMLARLFTNGKRMGQNGYTQQCSGCRGFVWPNEGHLYWLPVANSGQWHVVCNGCDSAGGPCR